MARLLFFGELGDLMGRERVLALPREVRTTTALVDHLCTVDAMFADAASRLSLRIAVNETLVIAAAPVEDSDEIAFLPPFSGG